MLAMGLSRPTPGIVYGCGLRPALKLRFFVQERLKTARKIAPRDWSKWDRPGSLSSSATGHAAYRSCPGLLVILSQACLGPAAPSLPETAATRNAGSRPAMPQVVSPAARR